MSNSLFGQGYDPKESKGGSAQLPAGGYIVKIMSAKMQNAQSSGLPMVVIQFDICEGEYKNYYHKKWDNAKNYSPDAKYGGIARIPAVDQEGKARKGFNSFCGAVEASNGCKLPTDDDMFLASLRGKYVGIIFGREEFEAKDGSTKWTTKPKFYRSVATIENGDFDVPEDEPLQKSSYDAGYGNDFVDSFAQAESELPF